MLRNRTSVEYGQMTTRLRATISIPAEPAHNNKAQRFFPLACGSVDLQVDSFVYFSGTSLRRTGARFSLRSFVDQADHLSGESTSGPVRTSIEVEKEGSRDLSVSHSPLWTQPAL